MINLFKTVSSLCMLLAIAWFAFSQDFGAVLLGIVSICVFMMSFLPVSMAEE
ncbi:hypothetical protein [Oxalicibacterium flavum]|uniref:hypothetical protein n=1 Tax=Oxalicibacterium flavum TaxID=179467 RepID=UPI00166A674E|nr:hypothetical protein [Oxalicibacterium flavum]